MSGSLRLPEIASVWHSPLAVKGEGFLGSHGNSAFGTRSPSHLHRGQCGKVAPNGARGRVIHFTHDALSRTSEAE
jgi:hypothetical protein